MSDNSNFPIGDGSSDRDPREFRDLIGLQSHRKTNSEPKSSKPGLTWYEFLFYVVLIVGFWILGQFTPAIPDEAFGDILVFAIAILRQRYLMNQ